MNGSAAMPASPAGRHTSIMTARLLLVLCLWVLCGPALAGGNPDDSAGIAVVNGTVISRGEFTRELDRIRRQKGIKGTVTTEARLAEMKREALDNLIDRTLLLQECRRRKITVPPAEIDREIERLKEDVKRSKGEFATDGMFAETVKKMKMDETRLREQVSQGLVIRALVKSVVGSNVTVSDDEVEVYYERHRDSMVKPPRVHLSHILVAVDPLGGAERKQAAAARIAMIRRMVAEHKDFAALAAEYSDDGSSKGKGGDIGWFVAGQLAPELEKAIDDLKAGEVSAPLEDRFGFHIVKVVERKKAGASPIEEVKGNIRESLQREKELKRFQPFVRELRNKAAVELLPAGDET